MWISSGFVLRSSYLSAKLGSYSIQPPCGNDDASGFISPTYFRLYFILPVSTLFFSYIHLLFLPLISSRIGSDPSIHPLLILCFMQAHAKFEYQSV
ncbi:hypothetical protein B9Z19DRAFT_108274 [Tuber borchii]|uniref:Uncharacterized protein n=1 Tax=Tuber borchii TaxID=42251 RepID=A0A2T6ZRP1_TUBBO|nr:hypothetical protein B9Z19DRAFT_108274 [Tuber borchii]